MEIQIIEEVLSTPYLCNFIYGLLGSLAVEVVTLYGYFFENDEAIPIPKRYKKTGFWLVRGSLAAVAGVLAVVCDPQHPIQAFAIGVTTPLIIKSFERTCHLPLTQQKGHDDNISE